MIDQKILLDELQSLQAQRKDTEEKLAQIAGAERMCRHLLSKGQRLAEQAQSEQEGENEQTTYSEAVEANSERGGVRTGPTQWTTDGKKI